MSTTTPASTPAAPLRTAGTRIRLNEVTKDYGTGAPAVDSISLTIEPGEFMTLLGPSGSGKTTTLNLIAGFESLTAGSIEINDVDVSQVPPHKRNLGMLFQNYALFPHMTVARNVGYPLRERRVPKQEIAERVDAVLRLVHLTGRDDAFPSQLSGGQQQRVALARAIVFNPQALLLDEPLGALDRNLRGALQAELRRIHREVGATFVFVTHDQEEAMNLSDRIALFNNGRLEQVGTPQALYREPETVFTARFLGDSTVFDLGDGFTAGTARWGHYTWEVRATNVSPRASSAESTSLVVRPEAISVSPAEDSAPRGSNAVSGVVRDIEYMGSYRMLALDFGEGTEGKAKIEPDGRSFQLGDRVTAWWDPAHQRVVAN